jgi:hypothetical protein
MTTENKIKARFAQEDQKAIADALTALAKHRDGRKFLWWILQLGHVGQQPFTGNALDTAFNCGQLNVGNKFLAQIIETIPETYVQMMKENADERRDRDRELGAARAASARAE